MLIIHGTRTAKIKHYSDHQHPCPNCKAFDLDVYVYRKYFHILFIPAAPVGEKTSQVYCNNCGNHFRADSMQKIFESISKTPIYFYSLPILFSLLIMAAIFANFKNQKENKIFVENPKIGDVYTIRQDKKDSTKYYFLKLVRINGDTIFADHSNLIYYRFISKPQSDDYFVKDDELIFTKNEIIQMFKKGEINDVERNE